MCDHTNDPGGREAAMTVIRRDEKGTPTVWCDPCLAPIVTALNAAGIATIASCCGHGKNDSSIALADGRWLTFGSEPPIAYEHRIEPQGEPSDAELLKLANDAHHRMVDEAESDGGWYGFSHSRDAWEDGFATGYRARAASSVTEQGEAEKPRCGGGRTHCRHDQWPPMHSMACPISKAAVTEQGENR